MQLQRANSKHYAFLPSGILIVEPNAGLLAARAQLLLAADYYVAASHDAMQTAGLSEMDVKVAILSQSLGEPTVRMLAQEIRLYYPNAQILIFGKSSLTLDDQLYDEAIVYDCRPEQLLEALSRLKQNSSRRPNVTNSKIGPQRLSLSGLGWYSLHRVPPESDPSKEPASSEPEENLPSGRDVPADESSPHLV